MKRPLILLAAITLLAALVVAAPALSVNRYRPEPVHFEMQAPKESLGARTASAFVSQEVRAPKRFNVVGFQWDGGAEPAIAVRVRKEGEDWSDWTTVPAHSDGAPDPDAPEARRNGISEPVWAGEADYLQYRLSNRPPDLRLQFINTTGTATALDRIETGVRSGVSEGLVTLANLTTASAGPGKPRIIPRRRWGARDCRPRSGASHGRVKVAFVHHTVSTNAYSRSQAKSMVLGICRFHRDVNGWNDIGYNFLVDRFGRIFEGRRGGIRRAVVGAHTEGFNAQSTGVAGLGTFESQRLPRPAVRQLAKLIRWKLRHHGVGTGGRPRLTSAGGSTNRFPAGRRVRFKRVSGHRDASPTACPGDVLYRQLRVVRRPVKG
jgi:N-acetylmuramoyl-L-alanine amidase